MPRVMRYHCCFSLTASRGLTCVRCFKTHACRITATVAGVLGTGMEDVHALEREYGQFFVYAYADQEGYDEVRGWGKLHADAC